jgi:hypothetical protein
VAQDFKADVLFGDWGFYCTPALSETLKLPRVTVSNIPIVDPLQTTWDRSTGRRMNVPNVLAYTPQVGAPDRVPLKMSALQFGNEDKQRHMHTPGLPWPGSIHVLQPGKVGTGGDMSCGLHKSHASRRWQEVCCNRNSHQNRVTGRPGIYHIKGETAHKSGIK